jgi:hypothetical protein
MTSPFDGSCRHEDIRSFYTSELDYLVAMRKRYACPNCATATGECASCQRTRERIEELGRSFMKSSPTALAAVVEE